MLNRDEFLTFGLHVVVVVLGITLLFGFHRKNNNVLQILQYPDPVLRKIAQPIDQINNDIITLSNDILSTLQYRSLLDFFFKGSMPRGLAATQVGIPKRLIVCGLNGQVKIMVNPEVLARAGVYSGYDDCMSVHKGDKKKIKRSAYIKVKYKNLDNMETILVARNRNAALLEHEIDHLNGVLNVDHWETDRETSLEDI